MEIILKMASKKKATASGAKKAAKKAAKKVGKTATKRPGAPQVVGPPPLGPQGAMLPSLDAQLMAFRTAWLRVVALVWYDMETRIKRGLPAEGDGALLKDLEATPQRVLEDKLGFAWPWGDTLRLVVDRAPVADKRLRWIGDDWAWDVNQAEQLTILVPLRPRYKEVNGKLTSLQEHPDFDALQALALADYYDARPSIFGTVSGGGTTPRGRSLVTSASLDIADQALYSISDFLLTASPIRFGGKGPPNGGFIPSGATFLNLEVALVSGLAKAWGNALFANLLDATKTVATVGNGGGKGAGEQALSTVRGYAPEWRLELRIEDDPDAFWIPPDGTTPSYWTLPGKNVLKLNFPEKPEEVRDISVALAAYNSTGAEFPFTCCA